MITIFIFLLISVLNLSSKLLTGNLFLDLGMVMGYIGIGLFIFSIYCLIKFRKQHLNKLTLIIPIWFIVLFILIIIFSFTLGILQLKSGLIPELIIDTPTFYSINLFHDILLLGFIIYLLYLFER